MNAFRFHRAFLQLSCARLPSQAESRSPAFGAYPRLSRKGSQRIQNVRSQRLQNTTDSKIDSTETTLRRRSNAWQFAEVLIPRREPYSVRQGERSGQCRNASVAQAVVLSVWHVVQGFGILYSSVIAGVMNANVCARTFTSEMVVSIFGIWQAIQLLPADPFL
jgi:hypothetical protein